MEANVKKLKELNPKTGVTVAMLIDLLGIKIPKEKEKGKEGNKE